jgi:hypothetical protein
MLLRARWLTFAQNVKLSLAIVAGIAIVFNKR